MATPNPTILSRKGGCGAPIHAIRCAIRQQYRQPAMVAQAGLPHRTPGAAITAPDLGRLSLDRTGSPVDK
jgi:hypothetical protein